MRVFPFLALFFLICNCSDLEIVDTKCKAIANFKTKLEDLSGAFYRLRFPRGKLISFQKYILDFVGKWELPLCLDCILEMVVAKMFPLNGSTRVYLFGTVIHVLSGKSSLDVPKILWESRRKIPPSSECLKLILEELINLVNHLEENYTESVSSSQNYSHYLFKLIRQLQCISLGEYISNDAIPLEKTHFLNAMHFFKTGFSKQHFLKLVKILKGMERDEFLFFYLLCNEFTFYLFAADEPDYDVVISMMSWDDKKESGHLLSWIFYNFLIENLEKLNDFANIIPFFDLHVKFFKNSLLEGKLSLEYIDTSGIEVDIPL
jgi:hypothetical protein